jgi:hypothetical protein
VLIYENSFFFRPYNHADALNLLLNCLRQFCERVKHFLNPNPSSNYEFLNDFRRSIDVLEQDIEEFIQKMKGKTRKSRAKRLDMIQRTNNKINTTSRQSEKESLSSPTSVDSSRSVTPPLQSSSRININSDDEEESFETVGTAAQLLDMMMKDSERIEDELDPFAPQHEQDVDIDPFTSGVSTTQETLVSHEKYESDLIDPSEISSRNQLSPDDQLLELIHAIQKNDTTTTSTKSSLSSDHSKESNALTDVFKPINEKLQGVIDSLKHLSSLTSNENGVILIESRCQKIIEEIQRTIKDGPVTTAVKQGQTLILEDINEPSQAVIERLNSLLEIEPSFILYEDLTSQRSTIPILSSFQIFATAHVDGKIEDRLQLTIGNLFNCQIAFGCGLCA